MRNNQRERIEKSLRMLTMKVGGEEDLSEKRKSQLKKERREKKEKERKETRKRKEGFTHQYFD